MSQVLLTTPYPTLVQEVLITRYCIAASITIFAYDYLLTLESEITLMWTSRWSFMKIAWLLQRYLPFFDTIVFFYYQNQTGLDEGKCRNHILILGTVMTCGISISEIILTLRVWAVWGNSKYVAALFILVYTLLAVLCFGSLGLTMDAMQVFSLPVPGLSCIVTGNRQAYAMSWMGFAISNVAMLIMMLIPAFTRRKMGKSEKGVSRTSTLLDCVYRDGILYYASISILSMTNVITILCASEVLGYALFISLERLLHSTLTSRAILQIRQEAQKRLVVMDSHSGVMSLDSSFLEEVSTIKFSGAGGATSPTSASSNATRVHVGGVRLPGNRVLHNNNASPRNRPGSFSYFSSGAGAASPTSAASDSTRVHIAGVEVPGDRDLHSNNAPPSDRPGPFSSIPPYDEHPSPVGTDALDQEFADWARWQRHLPPEPPNPILWTASSARPPTTPSTASSDVEFGQPTPRPGYQQRWAEEV